MRKKKKKRVRAGPAYLVLEVRVVLQYRTLVGACPHIVLHHVLLLGQVAIKLEQRHGNGTGHAMAQMAESLAGPRQKKGHLGHKPPAGGCTLSAGPNPSCSCWLLQEKGARARGSPEHRHLHVTWPKDTAGCHLDLESTSRTQDLPQAEFWNWGQLTHLRELKEAE